MSTETEYAMAEAGKFSRRALQMQASPIRKLAPLAVAAKQSGKAVHHLNIGQPDIPTPPEILDRMKTFDQPNVAYGPSEGLPEFVDAVRIYHHNLGLEVRNEDIFVTTGGSEALLFIFAAIADHGDEVVVFEPFYTNYSGFSALVGVRTVPVTLNAEDGYHLPSRETIESVLTERTRAMVLCSPNNPTGTVYSDEELEMIGDICRERGLYLVSDEVYREFTYDGLSHRSAMTLPGLDQQVIIADSLSKRVSMCGARVGWILTRNQELLGNILKFGQARLCPPTLGQYIGAGMNDISSRYMTEAVAEYEARRNLVYEALQEMPGVSVRRPEGAFYMCPKLPVDDADRFATYLLSEFSLNNETLMVAPAAGFYATPGLGTQEVRIAYVLCQDELTRAMAILKAALEVYPGRRRE